MSSELLQQTIERMEALADPAFEGQLRWFFQEPVDPFGIRSAKLRPLVRDVSRVVKKLSPAGRNRFCNALWRTGKLEAGVVVCHLYRRFRKQCSEAEFDLFEKWIDRFVHNWSHCDGVSAWLLAASIENCPALIDRLVPWTQSKNRWKRRASAVGLLQEAKAGRNTDRIFEISGILIHDPDDMVRKGVGWLLKETYPKRPRDVVAFLQPYKATAPRVLLRFAAEKMSVADRKAVL